MLDLKANCQDVVHCFSQAFAAVPQLPSHVLDSVERFANESFLGHEALVCLPLTISLVQGPDSFLGREPRTAPPWY